MKRFIKYYCGNLIMLLPFFSFSQVGNPAPDFTVTDVNGNTHRLYDYVEAGKVVIIDFYYTTCGPCQFYSPQVNLAFAKYGCNTANVIFLSVDYNDTDAEVIAYDNQYAIEFPSISGLDGGGNAVVSDYQIIGFPTFYVIDSSKTIIDVIDPPTLQVFDFRFAMHGILPASCTTSTEDENTGNEKISLFPNPISSNESLHLAFPESFNGLTRIEVYDFTGKLVQQQLTTVHNEKSMEVDVHTFLPGLYLIKIRPMSSNQFFAGVFEITKT